MPDETPLGPDPTLGQLLRDLARGAGLPGGAARAGEPGGALVPELVRELKAIARGHLARQRPGHTLQPSALVNEAYLKLARGGDWSDRGHFFALAARAMRQILVDHARKRRERGSGGCPSGASITLHEPAAATRGGGVDALDLHAALEELAARDERQARIVELKYFAELEVGEVAETLGVSKATVEREWRTARAWLGHRLRPSERE